MNTKKTCTADHDAGIDQTNPLKSGVELFAVPPQTSFMLASIIQEPKLVSAAADLLHEDFGLEKQRDSADNTSHRIEDQPWHDKS